LRAGSKACISLGILHVPPAWFEDIWYSG
jgi:hypothetical protein